MIELLTRQVNGSHVITSMPAPSITHRAIGSRFRAAGRELFRESETPAEAPKRTATIGCVIPAYNEEGSIAAVLDSILAQTRPPEAIHVVVNNTEDLTLDVVHPYLGVHERTVKGVRYLTEVHVHDIGENADKKVGALNYGWSMVRDHDYLLGVDGDTVLDRHCVEHLYREVVDDPRIGGLSSIYTVDSADAKGLLNKLLLFPGQRQQFASFEMDNLLAGRNMAVLGGQCSIFNMVALDAVRRAYHQSAPWVRDSEVEDSLLSLQIKKVGFSTKISAHARSNVGGMSTLRSLHAQQVKWTYGAIDLMWPGTRGNTQGQPFHPNLRLRWRENIAMLLNIVTRLAFLLLLVAALSIHAFVFNPIWLIPPAVAALLNLRVVMSMKAKTGYDVAYAMLALPAELYMWIKMGHFISAWTQFFSRSEKDNWAAQSEMEKGKTSAAWLYPFIGLLVLLGLGIWQWSDWDTHTQSMFLSFGWPLLYIVTVLQTAFMFKKLIRRHRGFQV